MYISQTRYLGRRPYSHQRSQNRTPPDRLHGTGLETLGPFAGQARCQYPPTLAPARRVGIRQNVLRQIGTERNRKPGMDCSARRQGLQIRSPCARSPSGTIARLLCANRCLEIPSSCRTESLWLLQRASHRCAELIRLNGPMFGVRDVPCTIALFSQYSKRSPGTVGSRRMSPAELPSRPVSHIPRHRYARETLYSRTASTPSTALWPPDGVMNIAVAFPTHQSTAVDRDSVGLLTLARQLRNRPNALLSPYRVLLEMPVLRVRSEHRNLRPFTRQVPHLCEVTTPNGASVVFDKRGAVRYRALLLHTPLAA